MTNDKQRRYDRQLRLWETSGQSCLESAHLCLINATPTGSEILKNLALPGIKNYTIIDDSIVTEENISADFFLQVEDIGKTRADALVSNLGELNSEVTGTPLSCSLNDILNEDHSFWNIFDVVVVCDYCPKISLLKEILWEKRIPLLIVNSLGFYGSLQSINYETAVTETHYSSQLYDLRIDKPWKELQEFSDSIILENLDDTDHAHVPYIVIFIKAMHNWYLTHKAPPKNYSEKKLFRSQIESMSRNLNLESNFREASNSYHRALQATKIPDSVTDLFSHPNIQNENINSKTPMFWIYVKALKSFIASNENQLPLSGILPDMASDTVSYVQLQNIYRDKASRDKENFTIEVLKLLSSIGQSQSEIDMDLITSFCKNSQALYVTHGSKSLYNTSMIQEMLQDTISEVQNDNGLAIYFSILTVNLYIETYMKTPKIENFEEFLSLFKQNFVPNDKTVNSSILSTLKEVLIHGTRNYHNVCSFMGGVASQEVLKLVTHQYIPIDNLFVFDGIKSVTSKWKV